MVLFVLGLVGFSCYVIVAVIYGPTLVKGNAAQAFGAVLYLLLFSFMVRTLLM
jgi:hypothetical protein